MAYYTTKINVAPSLLLSHWKVPLVNWSYVASSIWTKFTNISYTLLLRFFYLFFFFSLFSSEIFPNILTDNFGILNRICFFHLQDA